MVSTRDIIIKTDRLYLAKAFYNGVLGFELVEDTDRLLGFETGAFKLYVEPGSPSGPVFDLQTDDVQTMKAALLGKGCILEEEDPSIPRVYMRDPFGLIFNLDTQ